MTQNRFDEIKSVFPVADNNFLEQDSRMTKVKPLYDLLNTKIVEFGIVHESLSVDDSMVPYFGCHSGKQFIKAKSICFGFKLWVLASSTGMSYHLHIYDGKLIEKTEDTLGSQVLKRALAVCNSCQDHWVLIQLGEMGFWATGTMRNDRIENCPLVSINNTKKKDRGVNDQTLSADNIEIANWNNNSVVTIESNAYGMLPLGKVKRWNKGQGNINVEQPTVIILNQVLFTNVLSVKLIVKTFAVSVREAYMSKSAFKSFMSKLLLQR